MASKPRVAATRGVGPKLGTDKIVRAITTSPALPHSEGRVFVRLHFLNQTNVTLPPDIGSG